MGGEIAPAALVFLVSLCTLCLELAIGRVLSSSTGGGLFTWTSTVGAALIFLSLGSVWGGRLAQREKTPWTTARLLFGASLGSSWPLLGLVITGPKGPLSGLPIPLQSLVSAPLLLGPAVLFLSALLPIAATFSLEDSGGPGRIVGRLYAWGSMGCIAGSFLAGFLLIPVLGAQGTLLGCSCLLALLSGWTGKGPWTTRALVWGLCCLLLGLSLVFSAHRTPGLLFRKESAYHSIEVREWEGQRLLALDGMVHSRVDRTLKNDLGYDYERLFVELTLRLDLPSNPSFLCLGGGGYILPRYLADLFPNAQIDVVEIDEEVTLSAHRFLDLPNPPPFQIHHQDARRFVLALSSQRRYDVLYVDIFKGLTVPWHLCTQEFHLELARHLNPHGIYLLNLIDQDQGGPFLASMALTLKEVFPKVSVHWFPDATSHRNRATFILVSTFQSFPSLTETNLSRGSLGSIIPWENLPHRGMVLKDSYAPVDRLLLPVIWNLSLEPFVE